MDDGIPPENNESIELRITEMNARDAGRGLARLDPDDMVRLGAKTGDVILINGKRTTPARVMPLYPTDRGRMAVQIDGTTRLNARAGVGEKVRVTMVAAKPAASVVLKAAAANTSGQESFLRSSLGDLAVSTGDRVRLNLLGSRRVDFEVVDTVPAGVVVFNASTKLSVRALDNNKTAGRITYEDVGGLGFELQRIREMVELPLRYPELFERLGIEAPKGVLLCGPPGCGKTLMARAVAGETDAHFIYINGPEIMHKYYGESEAHVRDIFEQAKKHAPSIVFLDELDAIASRRTETHGEVEKRVVAQLLALMDGLESRGQVIVIGATNIPDALDPALRRPGRFDRELMVGVPSRTARREILDIHTKGMPLAEDVNLDWLAGTTHGFVGADMAALCREAAMHALRRVLPDIDLSGDAVPYEVLTRLEVWMSDFQEALAEIQPSALREVIVEVPEVKWDDIGGLQQVKTALREAIEWPMNFPELFSRAGIRPVKGILLCGEPGTGKTLLAKAAATECGLNFISIKGPELMSKYVGESEKALREMFRKARQAAPCILFFDEIDALLPKRGYAGDAHASDRMISQFLTELDGVEDLKGVFVLGATNRPDMIDPAILRPGRFDLVIGLPIPDFAARVEIYRVHTRNKKLASEVDLPAVAKTSEGLSGAEIDAICRLAALRAVRRCIQSQETTAVLERRDFEEALIEMKERKEGRW